ncbi:MAG: class I SAM-dependent methyltransferase [Chloroflexota bacterium]
MDPYQHIALHYDAEHAAFHDDIEFYLNLVGRGPVLEVGSGTGRIMLPLVESGLEVWGLDTSKAMLAIAQERLESFDRAHLVEGSVLDFSIDRQFPVVIFSLNMLWHLGDSSAQLRALEMVRRHVLPGGLVVIDLSNPLAMVDRGGHGEIRERFRQDIDNRSLVVTSASWDDEASQVLSLSLTYDETRGGCVRRVHSELSLRYTFRSEVELLLRLAGYDVQQIYGSYDLDSYGTESPNLITLATHSVLAAGSRL